jgi:nucleoside-diphosphate-sugar epimerase
MRKILITGGAGNIAGSLARRLVQHPDDFIVVIDNLSTGSVSKLPPAGLPNYQFIEGDVNDKSQLEAVMLSHSFDFVFHYAAVVGVSRTLSHPLSVLKDIDGIRNVFDMAKETGVKRVFYSSSSEVYGEPVSLPQHEEITPLNSRLPYAIVKNLGEAFCKSYYQEFGLPYTIFRLFNTYGPGQSEDFVLPRFLKAALRNEPVTIYGDGSQTRTFCYVDDNIDTTLGILDNKEAENQTINIGSDQEITMLDLAKKVIGLTGSSSSIIHLPPLKEGDMTRRKPDITRMKQFLHRPLTSLDEGINKLLAFYNAS